MYSFLNKTGFAPLPVSSKKTTVWLLRGIAAFLVVIVSSSGLSYGQSTYGIITGVVTDQSGAVVSGASAEARNQATGSVRTVSTDGTGEYRFLNVDPGRYTVTITTAEFAVVKDENVNVFSRETARSDFQRLILAFTQRDNTRPKPSLRLQTHRNGRLRPFGTSSNKASPLT